MNIRILGRFAQSGSTYLFKNPLILTSREGSAVEVRSGGVVIRPDMMGIDKLYYKVEDRHLTISDRLSDFYAESLNDDLWPLQLENGFIPYPFTVFRKVRKCLPGIELIMRWNGAGWEKRTSVVPRFRTGSPMDPERFRRAFTQGVQTLGKASPASLTMSFSGGFDSALLSTLLRDLITRVCHYSESASDEKRVKDFSSKLMRNAAWMGVDHTSGPINPDDVRAYFAHVDEPCCDSAGFAEFLIAQRVVQQTGDGCLVDGQGADGLFASDRQHYKEAMLGRLLSNSRFGVDLRRHYLPTTPATKALDYMKSTRTRFNDIYTAHHPMPTEYQREVDEAYLLYERFFSGLDRANFFAALSVILYFSNHGIEKIKTAASAFGLRFVLPFYEPSIVALAFEVPACQKVGYRSGKRILKRAFSEVTASPYRSEPFFPEKLVRRMLPQHAASKRERLICAYYRYFSEHWKAIAVDGRKNPNP